MKIRITHQQVVVPNRPAFLGGHEYDVEESLAVALIERGQAEEVKQDKSSKARKEASKTSKSDE